MGAKNPTPKRITHFTNDPEVKGETRPFRCADYPIDQPILKELPGGIDTLLKAFE